MRKLSPIPYDSLNAGLISSANVVVPGVVVTVGIKINHVIGSAIALVMGNGHEIAAVPLFDHDTFQLVVRRAGVGNAIVIASALARAQPDSGVAIGEVAIAVVNRVARGALQPNAEFIV